MTKNPIFNALAALGYIVLVACIMFYGSNKKAGTEDTLLAPIAIISLFTLSAAVMCYIFFYEPFQLFLANKKKDAIDLFLKTVGVFGIFTLLALLILFLI